MSNELSIYNEPLKMLEAAKMLAESNLLPDSYIKKPHNVLIALQYGVDLGMKPMAALYSIVVINNKPTLSSDAMMGLVMNHPEFAGVEYEEYDDRAVCVLKRNRNGVMIEVKKVYTFKDAQDAGLLGKTNWKNYKKRMMLARAKGYACKDLFSDVLQGFSATEEIQDLDIIDMNNVQTKEEVIEQAVNTFKTNNIEEAVFETVKEEEEVIEFVFTPEQEGTLKDVQKQKIKELYPQAFVKCNIDKFASDYFKKEYQDYTLSEFTLFYKMLNDIVKTNEISAKTKKEIKDYMEGEVK